MKTFLRSAAICLGCVAFLIGCSKTDTETIEAAPAPVAAIEESTAPPLVTPQAANLAPGSETLPGASDVRQALASGDYPGAVNRVMMLRGTISRDQWEEYRSLYGEVIDTLRAASATDPKAAQALIGLRAAGRGR